MISSKPAADHERDVAIGGRLREEQPDTGPLEDDFDEDRARDEHRKPESEQRHDRRERRAPAMPPRDHAGRYAASACRKHPRLRRRRQRCAALLAERHGERGNDHGCQRQYQVLERDPAA